MIVTTVLISAAVGAGAYIYAKRKKVSGKTAAVAGVASGAGTAAAVTFVASTWPILLLIGVPAAAIYYYGKSKGQQQKMLGPGG